MKFPVRRKIKNMNNICNVKSFSRSFSCRKGDSGRNSIDKRREMKKVGNEKLHMIRFCLPYHVIIITHNCDEMMKIGRKYG